MGVEQFVKRCRQINRLRDERLYPFKSDDPFFAQVDRLEDELMSEQEKYKAITEELEQTFAEMSGY